MIVSGNRLLITFLLASSFFSANAQTDLVFNKRFVECEDKWVAFRPDSTGSYTFGFIYIDQMAGLTLNSEGSFMVNEKNEFIPKKDKSYSLKMRLQNNNVRVAIIPPLKYRELEISDVPDWLHFYKDYNDTAARLQRWGFYYNDWGMSEKALEYLEPGYKMDPDFKAMAVELGFAYNALEKFDKAVPVLKTAIKLTPDDWYLYKELSYALFNLDRVEEAGEAALKGISYAKQDAIKAEMAYNMAYTYYTKKDKQKFDQWAQETLKWAKKNDKFYNTIKSLEAKIAQ